MSRCPLLEERFSKLKQTVIKPMDKDRVIESYQRVKQALEIDADRISKQGPQAIPEVDFSVVEAHGGLPESLKDLVRQTGCLIIRGVVSEQQATTWENDLRSYARRHPKVSGFPQLNPQTFSLFWTPAQVQIRSHQRVLKAMNAVSQLWHLSDDDALFDNSSQVIYADRFRIRQPSKGQMTHQNPHGSLTNITRQGIHAKRSPR